MRRACRQRLSINTLALIPVALEESVDTVAGDGSIKSSRLVVANGMERGADRSLE